MSLNESRWKKFRESRLIIVNVGSWRFGLTQYEWLQRSGKMWRDVARDRYDRRLFSRCTAEHEVYLSQARSELDRVTSLAIPNMKTIAITCNNF